MKIYMLWDMEGVSGLFTREQVWHWEEGVRPHIAEEGRQLLIDDVNSASQAALDAGATELIVSDTHSGGNNIRLERMLKDPRITYHASNFIKMDTVRRWMPGMDETVDGIMLLGHHAKAGTPNAFLPHTWTSAWADFRINGQSVGEIGIESCFAGHFNVPLVLVQGDDATQREVEDQFPNAVMATVKKAENNDLCTGLSPEAARQITAEKIKESIEQVQKGICTPFQPQLPMTVTAQYTTAEAAERTSDKIGIARKDDVTIETTLEHHCDVVKWILGVGLP